MFRSTLVVIKETFTFFEVVPELIFQNFVEKYSRGIVNDFAGESNHLSTILKM